MVITGVNPPKRKPRANITNAIKFQKIKDKYPNLSIRDARRLAGYSDDYHPPMPSGNVIESIEKERDKAIRYTGYTVTKAMGALNKIIDDPDEHSMPKIHAIRTANAMLPGYSAPTQAQITQRTLIAEFNNLGHDQLVNLANALKSDFEE